MASRNTAAVHLKSTVPAVANGQVYVGARGNNAGGALGSRAVSGKLAIEGLQPIGIVATGKEG
jgi:hypothetical protein